MTSHRAVTPLTFGTATARPGEKAWGQLPIREGAKRVSLPACLIHGAAPGEHVVLMANQHGGEYNGIEAVRRFCEEVDPARLSGTVFAIPSANPRAAMLGQPVWSEGETLEGQDPYHNPFNLYFNWPGRKGGKLAERVKYEVWTRAILAPHCRASLVLDLHCHVSPTAVYATNQAIADLAIVAGIRNSIITGDKASINAACLKEGIASMTIELAGQGQFYPESIETGRRAVFNLLKFWGMLPGRLELPEEAVILNPWRDQFEKGRTFAAPSFMDYLAHHEGLVVPCKKTYDTVRRGEVVCHLLNPFTGQVVEECRAPMTGAVYAHRVTGKAVCRKGQILFTLGIARRVRPVQYVRAMHPSEYKGNGSLLSQGQGTSSPE